MKANTAPHWRIHIHAHTRTKPVYECRELPPIAMRTFFPCSFAEGFSGAHEDFEDPVLLSDPLDMVELRDDIDSDDALSDLATDLFSGTAATRCFFTGWLQSSCK